MRDIDHSIKARQNEISEQKEKLSETRTALFGLSMMAVIVCLVAFGRAEEKPDTALFLMIGFVFMGLYIFIGTMETTLLRNLVGLKASTTAWIVLLACFTYVAKAKAVSDVNSIFHVDPSLLPMTVLATTALQVMSMLFVPVIAVCIITALVVILWRKEFSGSYDGVMIIGALIVSAAAQVMFSMFIWGWVNTDEQKINTIYRIAHFADFSSSFRCNGLDESKVSIIFVDPGRTQVVVAPKLEESFIRFNSKATWLQPLLIPAEFPKVACVYDPVKQEEGSADY